jgi:O-antigen/teichoic acid export membrane protein
MNDVGHRLSNPKVQEAIAEVQAISPQPADRWEIAAILESLGYTDRQLAKDFGYPDSLALGSEIYEYLRENGYLASAVTALLPAPAMSWQAELAFFCAEFSRSFLYAIPFVVSMLVDTFFSRQDLDVVPVQLSALLSPALMGSLIASGGFVQMILRRGSFYKNMNEPIHAQRSCRPIFVMGVVTSIFLGAIWIIFSFYRNAANDKYSIIAGIYFVVLSIMWQCFAMVSLRYKWATPISLVMIAVLFVICRLGLQLDAVTCQLVTMGSALAGMLGMLLWVYWQAMLDEKRQDQLPALPRPAAVAYMLSPYFLYGILYFGFLFADRFAAGWVLDRYSAVPFAISTTYQRPMDFALLNFLIVMPFAEYLAAKFSMWWYKEAKPSTPQDVHKLVGRLQKRYRTIGSLLLLIAGVVGLITLGLMLFAHQQWTQISLTMLGILGYLALTFGLWNTIILLTLNQMPAILRMMWPAVFINLICGYVLGNLWGVSWTPIGLLLGATLFGLLARRQVQRAIVRLDYCYFYSGY